MIKSNRTNELLIALHQGMHEESLWSTFLSLLKRLTHSDYASLIFMQGDVPMHESTELFAGRDVKAEVNSLEWEDFFRADPISYRTLEFEKVYKITELLNLDDPTQAEFRKEYLDKGGIHYSRYMRVGDHSGVSAWCFLLRDEADFDEDDEKLLIDIGPHLSIAVRNFAMLEDARFRNVMGERTLHRAGICWAAFDEQGRFIAASPRAEEMLAEISDRKPVRGGRILFANDDTNRAIINACVDYTQNSHGKMRTISLYSSPAIDALLLPFRSRPLAALALPAMLALWRTDSTHNIIGSPHIISEIFGLSLSEARLAHALLQGHNIEEAAKFLDLTIKTARQYTKQIYNKVNVRGQVDLVRKMLLGSISLS